MIAMVGRKELVLVVRMGKNLVGDWVDSWVGVKAVLLVVMLAA